MDIPLFLFAKAPIAGKVKTRLQSDCSADQAAEIAKVLLEESIIKAKEHWPGKLYLSVALDIDHPFLQKMLTKYSIELVLQGDGDLGLKMHQTFEEFGYPAAIMGCDAPHILPEDLHLTYDLLANGKSVLGPSKDGGYYLIGLGEAQKELFLNKEWGTSSVLDSTLQTAQKEKLDLELLQPLNDVDEWQDLVLAAEQIPSLKAFI